MMLGLDDFDASAANSISSGISSQITSVVWMKNIFLFTPVFLRWVAGSFTSINQQRSITQRHYPQGSLAPVRDIMPNKRNRRVRLLFEHIMATIGAKDTGHHAGAVPDGG